MNQTGAFLFVRNLQYQWAAVGNLKNRTSNPNVNSTSVLSEDFHYDLNNRLTSSQVTNGSGTQAAVTYAYDLAGDITCKSDVVSHDCSTTPSGYDYTVTPGVPGGPHAVKTAGSSAYAYDADGNMTSRAGTAVTWNSDGLPLSISQDASNNSAFSYAPDKHRYKQVAMNGGIQETTIYAGGMEIFTTGGVTTYKHTISAYGRPVLLDELSNNGTTAKGDKSVLLTDHLGSVDTVVDVSNVGPTSSVQSFDTFGRHRDPGTWQATSNNTSLKKHGFTDHEQLDNVGLVHMNGRVYDPNVGRFLSVDPVFQAPTNGQSVNPYSYVMNNPLSLTDPSGYSAAGMTIAEKWGGPRGGALAYASVTIDFGMGGSIGGEGGRDSNGNLITHVSDVNVDDMKAGDVVMAGGYTFVKGGDGSVSVYQGNGATSGDTSSTSTTEGGAGTGANLSASAAVGGDITQKQESIGSLDDSHDKPSALAACNAPFIADANYDFKSLNQQWKDNGNVKVTEDGDTIVITVRLNVSGLHAQEVADQVNAAWNGASGSYGGKNYRADVHLTAGGMSGDWHVGMFKDTDMRDLGIDYLPAGFNDYGKSKLLLSEAWTCDGYVAAHEFGHALGLGHAPEGSGSIMSYDSTRSVLPRELSMIANAYGGH